MPTADKLTHDRRFVGLFVGRSGGGKTVAECSFPGPIKVYDFDQRIGGILGAPWITPEMKARISYDQYNPAIRKDGAGKPIGEPNYVKLDRELSGLLSLPASNFPYRTIVLDSLTSASLAFLNDAIPISNAGRKVGQTAMAGPGDYGFEAQNITNVISYFRSLPIQNLIVSAHIVPSWGKPKDAEGNTLPYADSVEIGEKLSVRDKLAENVMIYFDHVFKFYRYESAGRMVHKCVFRSDLCKTTFTKAPMEADVTGKNFYEIIKTYMTEDAPSV